MNGLHKKWSWVVLVVYWPAQFWATHIPRPPHLQVAGSDVTLHFCAYFVLVGLFWLARFGGQRPDIRSRRLWLVLGFFAAYAAVDEWTQLLVGRHCSFVDWVADVSGCVAVLVLMALVRQLWGWLILWAVTVALLTHWPGESPFLKLPGRLQQFEVAFIFCGYLGLTLLYWKWRVERGCTAQWPTGVSLLMLVLFAAADESVNLLIGRVFDRLHFAAAVGAVVVGTVYHVLMVQQRKLVDRSTAETEAS